MLAIALAAAGGSRSSERVTRRVDEQFERGLLDEIRGLLARGVPETARPFGGLVYRQALEHLHGVRDEAATRALIAQENRRYARRQLIWFRKEPNLQWFDGPGESRGDTIAAVAAALIDRLMRVAPDDRTAIQPQPNIQDVFLNYVRREKLTVTIRMMDGSELEGRIKNFDRFALVLDHSRHRSHDLQARDRRHQDAESRSPTTSRINSAGVTQPPLHAEPSSSSSTASASASCRTRPRTATRAATRSATSRGTCRCSCRRCARSASVASSTLGGAVAPIDAPRGRRRPHGRSVAGQGLGHRPLGDDGHRARPAVPDVSRRLLRRTSSRSSRGGPAAACSATRPRRARQIIDELGAEHMRTGAPIVYTSADSVFQIAAHEDDRAGAGAVSRLRDRLRAGRRRARRRPRHRAAVRRRAGRVQAHREPPRLRAAAAGRDAARSAEGRVACRSSRSARSRISSPAAASRTRDSHGERRRGDGPSRAADGRGRRAG